MDPKLKRALKITAVLIVIGVVAYFVLPVSVPLIMAFLTAALFEPLIRWGRRRLKWERKWLVTIIYALFLFVLAGGSYLFISRGISELLDIAERIPYYTMLFIEKWDEFTSAIISSAEDMPLPVLIELEGQLDKFLITITEPLRTFDYIGVAAGIGKWLPMFIISVIVYLIAVFLFMIDMPNVIKGFFSHLKEETAQNIRLITNRVLYVFTGFFKAQVLISFIILAVSFLGLLFVLPVRLALIVSLIVWIIDVIPIIGSIVILGPWALIELILGDMYRFIVLSILAVILLIIRRTTEPKVMGQYMGLSPLATLIAMFIGAQLFGFIGFLLGPIIVIVYITAREAGIIRDFKL